ncbi:hypothetical protein [Deinococcus fonticola]|uniref:hypothetical protein n=1 Tax=Deinococcus fonticola TaxID=2528713 RepID=UPI001430A0F6|nr:hypothetical protein [Deinococcus fonticola]
MKFPYAASLFYKEQTARRQEKPIWNVLNGLKQSEDTQETEASQPPIFLKMIRS